MSSPFSEFEDSLWDDAFGDGFQDSTAEALFHAAYFSKGEYDSDQLGAIRDSLREYLSDEYGIDFDEVFDWDAWREGYEES